MYYSRWRLPIYNMYNKFISMEVYVFGLGNYNLLYELSRVRRTYLIIPMEQFKSSYILLKGSSEYMSEHIVQYILSYVIVACIIIGTAFILLD